MTVASPLSAGERKALLDALDDEHKAWATYDQVLRDFGDVLPFRNIRRAEARHIAALENVCRRYGVPVPANPWPGRVPRYATLVAAYAAGVEAEIDNAALYERLLGSTDRPDVLCVFRNLQRASQERHLEAFRRCAARRQGSGGRGRCSRNRAPDPGRTCRLPPTA